MTVKPVVKGSEYISLLPYFPLNDSYFYEFEKEDNPFTELLNEDDSQSQVYEWYMMQDSIGTEDHPTLLDPGSVRVCGSDEELTWSSVFNFINTPVRASAEMLEKANAYMDASSLEEAGVCKEEIPIILDAYDKLLCTFRQKNPMLGAYVYVYYGDVANALSVYQSAFVLIEVPPWGDSPRRPAADLEGPGAEKKEKIEHEYRHIFDDDNKKLHCWK